ncbi:hypothetical protein [Brevibacillus brevis]|uniref:hypothetical protein n=1 Tax=Brevibacillus brevis TaxID=1393 RepID=UPI001476EF41|nr:hypothetical protein [Brevibacillus brevis]
MINEVGMPYKGDLMNKKRTNICWSQVVEKVSATLFILIFLFFGQVAVMRA